jgi:hypothetical protein
MKREQLSRIVIEAGRNYSPHEIFQGTDISVATLATWRSRHCGPQYVRAGKKVIYRVADVLAYLDARASDPAADARPRMETGRRKATREEAGTTGEVASSWGEATA